MKQYCGKDFKLGILGGGQLGKMLIQAASVWDIDTYVLDPTIDCPASKLASKFIKGDFNDFEAVYEFGKMVDLITIEIEHVNTDALIKLQQEGKTINPDPNKLSIIQDKGKQKEFYSLNDLATAEFKIYKESKSIIKDIENGLLKLPFVQKICRFGYDGRGVLLVNNENDLDNLMEGESVIEDLLGINKEVSVIVAQNLNGDIRTYVPFEMEFNKKANLVEYLISPARISEKAKTVAIDLAESTIKALGIQGVLAVEMFVDKYDNVLINESAPRPHNSGHHTIDSAVTSQYEQHIRAIMGLPLGSTELVISSVMVNILGEEGFSGDVRYEGLDECVSIDGVKVHIYGKRQTKPFRKMGHVTIIDKNLENALEKADKIKRTLRSVT